MVEIKREWGMGKTSQYAAEQGGIEMKFYLYALNDRYICVFYFSVPRKKQIFQRYLF